MNISVTSKEEILKISRQLVQQQGWSAVNIRSVASACGVSVGSIYNYFDSKSQLVTATVESVWCDIFHSPQEVFQNTQECIQWLYQRIKYGKDQYPGFFTLHSMGFLQQDTATGREKMQQTWTHIQQSLCSVLYKDPNISPYAFDEQFTREKFADLLFSLLLSALLRGDDDPTVVLELVRRTLYNNIRPTSD